MTEAAVEGLLRQLAPSVLAALARRHPRFDFAGCEDAVQEALLEAARQWPAGGVPEHPRAWLLTVAERRLVDEVRSAAARRRREERVAALEPADAARAPGPDAPDSAQEDDDTLTLLFLCCHPSLTPASQVALTLRAVGGLTTAEIAHAFLVPEATMAQRISRAKSRLRGAEFVLPPAPERSDRLAAVLHVLYLIFNEGYTASSGPDLQRPALATEAIRLTRELHRLVPDDGAVTGLLALMLLTDARRPARTDADGALIPLADEDRAKWNRAFIDEGTALLADALPTAPVGPYQLQAAIAAVHDEAPRADATDWPQILALYRLLDRIDPSPVVTINQAVAVAMVEGAEAGLAHLSTLTDDDRVTEHHRLLAVTAYLVDMTGDHASARDLYSQAAAHAVSLAERRHLEARAAQSMR